MTVQQVVARNTLDQLALQNVGWSASPGLKEVFPPTTTQTPCITGAAILMGQLRESGATTTILTRRQTSVM